MKYLVKATVEYVVEAESSDEAENIAVDELMFKLENVDCASADVVCEIYDFE